MASVTYTVAPPLAGGGFTPTGTVTALACSPDPATVGAQVTCTATVSPAPDGGTVAFSSDGKPIGGCGAVPVDTSTGKATCQATYGALGAYAITASYSGDGRFAASRSSTLTERVRISASVHGHPSAGAGAVSFTIRCASGSGGCKVTGILTTGHAHAGAALATSAAQLTVLGRRMVTIAAGRTRTVTIKLNRTARGLLARHGKLAVTLTITLTADGRRSTITTTTLTIKPAAKHPGKH